MSEKFAKRGVQVMARSSDGEEQARRIAELVSAKGVKFSYDLSLRSARPQFQDLLGAKDYPARGEFTAPV